MGVKGGGEMMQVITMKHFLFILFKVEWEDGSIPWGQVNPYMMRNNRCNK